MDTTKITAEIRNFMIFASTPNFEQMGKSHLLPAQSVEYVLPEGVTTSQFRQFGMAIGHREVISW